MKLRVLMNDILLFFVVVDQLCSAVSLPVGSSSVIHVKTLENNICKASNDKTSTEVEASHLLFA